MSAWKKYLLLQIPGWILAVLLLAVLHRRLNLPLWAAIVLYLVYVGKDFILYPYLRSAYTSESKTGAEKLIGAEGRVQQQLDPEGYVRVHGELWRAVADPPGETIPQGSRIHVREAHGMRLVVRAMAESNPQ